MSFARNFDCGTIKEQMHEIFLMCKTKTTTRGTLHSPSAEVVDGGNAVVEDAPHEKT